MTTGSVDAVIGRDHIASINGLRIHYREAGPPDAARVVVLHGIMGHAREWDTLVATLAADRRVFAVDQRGHGETDWADVYTAAAMADDIVGLIDHVDTAPVSLVGHSMGAIAASICAAERPDLIERLVMVDIGPDSLNTDWAVTELPAMLAHMAGVSYTDTQEAVDEWLAGDPLAREPLLRHYVEHNLVRRSDGRLVWRFDAANLVRFVTNGVTEDQLWSALDRIAVATLLVRGEHSPLLSRATAAEMTRRLPDGGLIEIAGGAHDLGVQQPEAVAAVAHAFLSA